VNPSVLNINKILSPLVGGLLAALLFLWQKTMMVDKEVNYSKDALRGSI
jgi:phosphate/sulfate permease